MSFRPTDRKVDRMSSSQSCLEGMAAKNMPSGDAYAARPRASRREMAENVLPAGNLARVPDDSTDAARRADRRPWLACRKVFR